MQELNSCPIEPNQFYSQLRIDPAWKAHEATYKLAYNKPPRSIASISPEEIKANRFLTWALSNLETHATKLYEATDGFPGLQQIICIGPGEMYPIIFYRKIEGEQIAPQRNQDGEVVNFQSKEVKKFLNKTPTERINAISGLIDAVKQLHTHNLVHGDIKPENLWWDGEFFILGDYECTQTANLKGLSN